MKKVEFVAIYQQIELLCNADQSQAGWLAKLLRKNNAALGIEKNGMNFRRTCIFLDIFAECGSDYTWAWKVGNMRLVNFLRWNGWVLPLLQEAEVIQFS
jgi:hypothetical protein